MCQPRRVQLCRYRVGAQVVVDGGCAGLVEPPIERWEIRAGHAVSREVAGLLLRGVEHAIPPVILCFHDRIAVVRCDHEIGAIVASYLVLAFGLYLDAAVCDQVLKRVDRIAPI